jgi:hypothetical protein
MFILREAKAHVTFVVFVGFEAKHIEVWVEVSVINALYGAFISVSGQCKSLSKTQYNSYYIKYECFIEISSTDKSDNLTCEIIYDNLENYRFSFIAFL